MLKCNHALLNIKSFKVSTLIMLVICVQPLCSVTKDSVLQGAVVASSYQGLCLGLCLA